MERFPDFTQTCTDFPWFSGMLKVYDRSPASDKSVSRVYPFAVVVRKWWHVLRQERTKDIETERSLG
jgi:hypothetical protein